jgi:hypothetical protein
VDDFTQDSWDNYNSANNGLEILALYDDGSQDGVDAKVSGIATAFDELTYSVENRFDDLVRRAVSYPRSAFLNSDAEWNSFLNILYSVRFRNAFQLTIEEYYLALGRLQNAVNTLRVDVSLLQIMLASADLSRNDFDTDQEFADYTAAIEYVTALLQRGDLSYEEYVHAVALLMSFGIIVADNESFPALELFIVLFAISIGIAVMIFLILMVQELYLWAKIRSSKKGSDDGSPKRKSGKSKDKNTI